MTFNCGECGATYDKLKDMEEIQITEGMREYMCTECESDKPIAELECPTD